MEASATPPHTTGEFSVRSAVRDGWLNHCSCSTHYGLLWSAVRTSSALCVRSSTDSTQGRTQLATKHRAAYASGCEGKSAPSRFQPPTAKESGENWDLYLSWY